MEYVRAALSLVRHLELEPEVVPVVHRDPAFRERAPPAVGVHEPDVRERVRTQSGVRVAAVEREAAAPPIAPAQVDPERDLLPSEREHAPAARRTGGDLALRPDDPRHDGDGEDDEHRARTPRPLHTHPPP